MTVTILNIATLLSQGKPMPFQPNSQSAERGDIFYLCKEDDVEEVINPRLIAMGADLNRFHIVDEPFYLDTLHFIEKLLTDYYRTHIGYNYPIALGNANDFSGFVVF